jgi:hypothetical protein
VSFPATAQTLQDSAQASNLAVGFQNTGMALDQWFQAATSYSLRSPPKIGRRRILPWTRAGTGDVGRVCVPRTPSPSLSSTFPEGDLDITVPTRASMIALLWLWDSST